MKWAWAGTWILLCSTFAMAEASSPDRKYLIAYLSRTNNTKAIAEIIHGFVGGDLVALELLNPYPKEYKKIVDQVAKENETGFLPPLKTRIDGMSTYDVVFVGFPTWGMELPPPVKSFLSQYDLGGKTVVPFNTNAGYGVGNAIQTLKALCPRSVVLDGFSTQGGVERDGISFVISGQKEKRIRAEVKQWLQKIGMSSSHKLERNKKLRFTPDSIDGRDDETQILR